MGKYFHKVNFVVIILINTAKLRYFELPGFIEQW